MKSLTALASIIDSATFHADEAGMIIESNPPFTQLMRCVPGDDWRINVEESDRALVDSFWASLFVNTDEFQSETLRFHLAGVEDPVHIRSQLVSNGDGPTTVVAIIEREQSSTVTRWRTDPVTGLPEAEAALGRFEEYLETGKNFGGVVVLLDAASASDEVLRKEAARQLLSIIRPTDLLTSSSDGRFVLCAAGIDSEAASRALAGRMLEALDESSLTGRIGLVLPDHDAGPATLLREAEAGAYASELGSFSFAPE